MKKRNIIIAAAIAAVAGTGIAYAGAKFCDHEGGYSRGSHGHRMEYMIDKMGQKLSLSSEQTKSIEEILEASKPVLREGRHSRHDFRQEMMALDPSSDSYEADVRMLADKTAEMARNRTLEIASVVKQISDVLTEEQRQQAKSLILEKMDRKGHRDHKVDEKQQTE